MLPIFSRLEPPAEQASGLGGNVFMGTLIIRLTLVYLFNSVGSVTVLAVADLEILPKWGGLRIGRRAGRFDYQIIESLYALVLSHLCRVVQSRHFVHFGTKTLGKTRIHLTASAVTLFGRHPCNQAV
jgi:hypothetical protein